MYFRHCLQTSAIIYVWKDSCSFPEFEKVNVKIWLGLKWCVHWKGSSHFFLNFPQTSLKVIGGIGKSGSLLSASCKSSFITAHSLKPRPPVSIQIYAFLSSFQTCVRSKVNQRAVHYSVFSCILDVFLQIPLVGRPLSEVMQTCFENFPNETSTSKLNLL